jgi:tetratricopeptide (TPR) repeat protein
MGVIYDGQLEYEAAIQAYNRATQIDPNYTRAWHNKNMDIDLLGIELTYPYP